jgi:hypothetical protein
LLEIDGVSFGYWPNLNDLLDQVDGSVLDLLGVPVIAGRLKDIIGESEQRVLAQRFSLALVANPRVIRHSGVQSAGEQREVAECLNYLVPARLILAGTKWPVLLPLLGANVLNGKSASGTSLLGANGSIVYVKASTMILKGFKDNSNSGAPHSPIDLKVLYLASDLSVIGPVSGVGGLIAEELAEERVGFGAASFTKFRNGQSKEEVVVLRRSAHQ